MFSSTISDLSDCYKRTNTCNSQKSTSLRRQYHRGTSAFSSLYHNKPCTGSCRFRCRAYFMLKFTALVYALSTA